MDDRSPEVRRKTRLGGPPLAFLGGMLLVAGIVILVVLVIWAVGGFCGQGAEWLSR